VIKMPWNLTLEDRSCLAPGSEVYNLGPVTLRPRCTVAQQAYLCGGTHDLTLPNLPLVVGPIVVGADAFVGARAFVLPGVTIGDGAVVGACALVSKDVEPWTVVGGNPAKVIGSRQPLPPAPDS
jgi:putative colanic acid biosynthesis acetyltransferase WcaF